MGLTKIGTKDVALKFFGNREILKEVCNGEIVYEGMEEGTVSGNLPQTLPRALAKPLVSLTREGKMEQRNLPQGYTQAEYLRQTYSAAAHAMRQKHFDTGYIPQGDEVIEWSMKIISFGTSSFVIPFGCRVGATGTSATNYWFGVSNTGAVYCRFGTVNPTISLTMTTGTLYKCKIDIPNGVITINGTDYAMTGTSVSGITDSLWLMTLNQHEQSETSSISCDGSFDLIDFKISRNGVEVYHAYPTTTPGVFDTVSGTENTTIGGTYGAITAGSAATPTPDNPQDLWCNNGRLVAKNPSGIPLAYEELEYLESRDSGSVLYINTGLNFNAGYTYEITYSKGGAQNIFMGARVAAYNQKENFSVNYYTSTCVYSSTATAATPAYFGDTTFGVQHTIKYQRSTRTLLFDGTDKWLSEWVTDNDVPYPVYLFAVNQAGTPVGGRTDYARIYAYSVKDANGVLLQNFVPARRRSDSELGMYETVSGTLFTGQGTGTFTAGNAVAPIVEAVDGVVGKNLFDKNNTSLTVGQYLHVDTHDVRSGSNELSVIYQLAPGKTYTLTRLAAGASIKVRVGFFDTATPTVGTIATGYQMIDDLSATSITFTVPEGKPYMFATIANSTNSGRTITEQQCIDAIQIELGSTATPYEPYREGEVLTVTDGTNTYTATVSDLLAVGDYKDTHELISGLVTHRIGYKVFDGTETWQAYSGISGLFYSDDAVSDVLIGAPSTATLCTHYAPTDNGVMAYDYTIRFQISGSQVSSNRIYIRDTRETTATAFANRLATEYASGNPVVVLYPLATSTTEQLTAQPMDTARGDNVVESENSVPQVSATIVYKRRRTV